MKKTVNERLIQLMDYYKLNGNAFAKQIDSSASVIHNVIKGNSKGIKTKPSFELLEKILSSFNNIDANWLLKGEGNMFISENENPKKNNSVEKNEYFNNLEINHLEDRVSKLEAEKQELYELLKIALKNSSKS